MEWRGGNIFNFSIFRMGKGRKGRGAKSLVTNLLLPQNRVFMKEREDVQLISLLCDKIILNFLLKLKTIQISKSRIHNIFYCRCNPLINLPNNDSSIFRKHHKCITTKHEKEGLSGLILIWKTITHFFHSFKKVLFYFFSFLSK